MGIEITQDQFSEEDYQRFNRKIRDNLRALEAILERPDFGVGEDSLGAELEFYLVDAAGRPASCNQNILQAYRHPNLTPELNRFNLEYNLQPQPFAGKPFQNFEQELTRTLRALRPITQQQQVELIPIGILPTLKISDFGPQAMTDLTRYRVMDNALRQLRGQPFAIDIDGDPPLSMHWDDVTLEGANTSFQVHWRINPSDFAASFNAVQLVTPIALGLAANSPTLFGHTLWEETRIALFKQSIDCRADDDIKGKYPPRVYFGNGWIHQSALELFASSVAVFPPIMPVCSDTDPLAQLAQGQLPELKELGLHQGSTWPWNRAIYDHQGGGHIRIEMRTLPAGPSLEDMSANAAFLVGSALALRDSMAERVRMLPFKNAEYNFYRAAQEGLDARLLWPSSSKIKLVEYPLLELAQRLVPLAQEALIHHGMAPLESNRLMQNIQLRINKKINGARWQKQVTERFRHQGMNSSEALSAMFQSYREHYRSGLSLSEWSL